jgi:alpha-methylacyl-CoA racemase
LIERADILLEGFRPGVMERLELGPQLAFERNPRLIYGRMTGWGQAGPLSQAAAHDINYIAITGALDAIGSVDGPPVPPLNLVGDYGGGALYLALGVLAALTEARTSGLGQVVDAAICDGTISLLTGAMSHILRGKSTGRRGGNFLDGSAPYYGVYETSDGFHVSIGSIEPQFYAELCERLGLPASFRDAQHDHEKWPDLRDAIASIFLTRTRDQWAKSFEGTDMCFAPILSLAEAPHHPHLVARQAFLAVDGILQPAPAPRFSRTPSAIQGPAPGSATAPEDVLSRWS